MVCGIVCVNSFLGTKYLGRVFLASVPSSFRRLQYEKWSASDEMLDESLGPRLGFSKRHTVQQQAGEWRLGTGSSV